MTYDNFSETFAKSRQNMHWPELDYFTSNFKPGLEAPRILDIGCGSGRLIPYLEKAYGKFTYLGIDSSSGMIKEAKKEHAGYDFEVLDMTDMDTISTKFDMIFFIASFHHLDNVQSRRSTLSKLNSMLSQDGLVFMTNWNLLGEKNLRRYQEMHVGNGDFQIKIGEHHRYYHSFSISELYTLFSEAHFNILENRVYDTGNNIISVIRK